MMKRILIILLMSGICFADEYPYGDVTELVDDIDRGRILSDETRYGDFTELVGSDYASRTFTVVNKIEKGKAIVVVIQDSAGPKYCIKQIRTDAHPKKEKAGYLIGHVRDVVASYVFESMNIRANKVRIIPAAVNFPGKYYPNRLATLHTFAPGSNRSHDFPFSLRLSQYLKSRVSVKDRGLTLSIINDMSQHDDLPPMVAGDTFVSNPDRSGNNLFWDTSTGRFCGIDMELAFKLPLSRNLSEVAFYQIDKFLKSPRFYLTKQQYRGLEMYNQVLKGLIEKNNPNDTTQLFKNIADYANIMFKGDFVTSDHSLRDYEEKIHTQHMSSKKLAKAIDTLLQSLQETRRRLRFH